MTLPDKLKKGYMFRRVDNDNCGLLYYDGQFIEMIPDLKKIDASCFIDDWLGIGGWQSEYIYVADAKSDFYLIHKRDK